MDVLNPVVVCSGLGGAAVVAVAAWVFHRLFGGDAEEG